MGPRTDRRMAQGRQRAWPAGLGVRGHLRLHLSRRPQGRGPLALSDAPHKHRRPRRSRPSRDTIKDRVSIHQRPKNIDARTEAGHWEGDLIICKRTRPVLVLMSASVTLSHRLGGDTAADTIPVTLAIFAGT